MNFNQLIELLLKADRKAQQTLFHSYAKKLMGVAVRYVKDEPTAQDVVQEAFIRIFNSLDSLHNYDQKTVEAWMRKIVAREAIRWIKKNDRYIFKDDHSAFYALKSPTDDRLEQEDLVKLLNALPSGYRAIFNMYVIEGYSHKEIGELLNITESTSRSQLTRAKKQLQTWIQKNMEYDLQQ